MIKIIVDSTCDADDEILREHAIDMISLQVSFEGKTYRDKKDVDVDTIYKKIKEGIDIKTSLPTYEEVYETMEKIALSGMPGIMITFSSLMSGTYNFCHMVLKDILEKYPDAKIAIIDSKTGGVSTTLLLMKILEQDLSDENFDHVVNYANQLASHVEHAFIANDLSQLQKGGRISSSKAFIGSLLGIKPLLVAKNGAINHHKSAIGLRRGLKELVNYVDTSIGDKKSVIGISFASNANLVDEIKKVFNKLGFDKFIVNRIGSVMASHIGLDAVGVGFFNG